MEYWGHHRHVMERSSNWWESVKIGGGAAPIETSEGWLLFYHGVSGTCNGFVYRLKACILDAENPAKILGHTRDFILWPEHDYEMKGRVANVTFACNALPEPDGTLKIYYGAADTNIGLATGKINEIVRACLQHE